MKIAIGSDKSGYVLKEAIKQYLKEKQIEFDDLGTIDINKVHPYFQVASDVAIKIQDATYDKAILICGTGAGMCIVSNKFKGVNAVVCEGVYSAKMARAINGARVLCMGGWIIAPELGIQMVEAFLNTEYLQDLEEWRKTWLTNAAKEVVKIEENKFN